MIKDILVVQKRELEKSLKEAYVERAVKRVNLNTPLIKVIIGPRRAGKSFFAVHLLKEKGSFGYVNFDDERLVEVKDYDEIVVSMNSVYGNPKFVLLDEIQNLPKWELFVNRLQRQGYNLVVTGSNAMLLSKELATHITGRHVLIQILPFSFREYLGFEGGELTSSEIRELLSQYVLYGGYPEPLVKKLDYKEYLSTLFSSVVYKDIVKRYSIRSPQGIENLALYLLSNISREYSYNSLKKLTNIKSAHTVEKYLSYLEEAFIFFSLTRFSYKIKEQLSSNKKVYCIDNGFVYSKVLKASQDSGRLYENVVANELKRRESSDDIKIYYWKNQQQEEVDFLVMGRGRVEQLVQVCFDPRDLKTKSREVRSLLKAGKELKCKNLLVVTENYEKEENAEWFGIKGKIRFIPLWKWLSS